MSFRKYLNDTRFLSQLTRILFLALVVLVLGFGTYYYFDRYVYIGDLSPAERSVAAMEDIVREDPEDPERRVALAEAYLESRNYSAALDQAQQVLKSYPENDRALLVIGISLVYQDNREDAIPFLEKFVALRGKSPTAGSDMGLEAGLYFLGESYLQQNRAADAIPVLNQAIQINRTDADAMYQLGLAYAATADHNNAIQQYHNAVRFVPNFTEAYQAMENSYSELDQPDYVAFAKGMVYFSQKDYQSALKPLEETVQKLPEFIPGYLGLGLTYEQLGDLPAASKTLEQALQMTPDNFTVAQALGRIQSSMSK